MIVAFTPARLDQLHPRQKQVMRDSGFRLTEEWCFQTPAATTGTAVPAPGSGSGLGVSRVSGVSPVGCKFPSPGSQPACPATPERPVADALGFRPAEHRTSPCPLAFSPVSLKASGSGDGVGPAEAQAQPLQAA